MCCTPPAVATSDGMCADGEIRLQMTSENVTGNSLEGRLEVCVNSAWGTVCDSLFDAEDAQVACSGLSGFSAEGMCAVHHYFSPHSAADLEGARHYYSMC